MHRHPRILAVGLSEENLDQMIDQSPEGIQQTGERKVEKPQDVALRGRFRHEAFDLLVANFDFLAITIEAYRPSTVPSTGSDDMNTTYRSWPSSIGPLYSRFGIYSMWV